MSSGGHRTTVKLLLVAVAATIVFPLHAPAGARARDPRPKGLSLDDAAYYLDISRALPPSFQPLNPEDFGGEVLEDSATTVYGSDESGALVILHLMVGKGRTSRVVMEELFDRPDNFFVSEDLSAYLADQGIPTDQVSVTPGTWSDAAVGDRAVTAVHGVEVEGERSHFEVLVMLVGQGKDTALVEIDHLFTAVPTVDVTDVAGTIAAKVRSGPPSPDQKIANAGLITLADLPPGWESAPNLPTTTAGSGPADPDDSVPDHHDEVIAAAKEVPGCNAFASLLDAGSSTKVAGRSGSNTTGRDTPSLDGDRFRQGQSRVTSEVSVYPTPAAANGLFKLIRDPSAGACLTEMYREAAKLGLQSGGASLPPAQQESLKHLKVTVTTPQSPEVGDDHMLFRITVDLNPIRDVRFVIEQEFVQAGRAVGSYNFAGPEGATPRDQVLPIVVGRLAAAQ